MAKSHDEKSTLQSYIFSSKITVNVKSYNATRLYYSIGQDVMSCRSTNQVPYTCFAYNYQNVGLLTHV